VEQLFLISIKYDSFKVAFYLNQKFGINFNKKVIEAIYNSLKESQWYVEMKLFFIRAAFPYLNVA
jgi:hypothetical protein